MSFPNFANSSPGEFLRDAHGNPLPDPGLFVMKHIDRLERENAALRKYRALTLPVVEEMCRRIESAVAMDRADIEVEHREALIAARKEGQS